MKLTDLEKLVKAMREELITKSQADCRVEFYTTRNTASGFLDTSREFLDMTLEGSVPLSECRICYPAMSDTTPIRGWAIPLVPIADL